MYWGSRRMAAITRAQVSSAVAGAGFEVDVAAVRAGLADQPQLGQLFEQGAREVGALPDQHQGFGITQPHGQLAGALDGVGEDLGLQAVELAGALQLADGVLIVVQDDDVHGAYRCQPQIVQRLCNPGRGQGGDVAQSRRAAAVMSPVRHLAGRGLSCGDANGKVPIQPGQPPLGFCLAAVDGDDAEQIGAQMPEFAQ